MNYKNKKIVIFGLGIYKNGSGISAAEFFVQRGANLLITDLKTEKDLAGQIKKLEKYKKIQYILGRHRKEDFENTDYVFKNPSVPKGSPYLKIARKKKIPIINDWTIYFEERPSNLLIGITGTKGKSTTASLIYEILKSAKKNAVLCGNIGQSPLAILKKIRKNTVVVAELSSWALQEFKTSPQISVITNLMPEHLDKYKNLNEYYKDKENIFKFQKKNDYLIINKKDRELKKRAKKAESQIIWFSPDKKFDAAGKTAKILKVPQKIINKTIKNFKGIPGRLELVKEKNGIKYYNDTTATMPDATIYALRQLERAYSKKSRRIILIAGGVDKKLDYKNMTKEILKHCRALILFEGTASDKITQNGNSKIKIIKNIKTMKQAVKTAQQLAKKNDTILLSPGAASFNLFKNEFDRGEQFFKAIR